MNLKRYLKPIASRWLDFADRIRGRPVRYCFILAHMRSGSSLLNHILMSHPEILGCGERNAYYRTVHDFAVLRLKTRWRRKKFGQHYPYFVDQINHNQFTPNAAVLNDDRLKIIFLLREPVASVSSMVQVLGKHYGTTLEQAVNYYVERLSTLAAYAQLLDDKSKAIFLTYADLCENTPAALAALRAFLGLRAELSEQYQTFAFTGQSGDPGPKIGVGKVLRERDARPIALPPDSRDRVQAAYQSCWQTLAENIASIGSVP